MLRLHAIVLTLTILLTAPGCGGTDRADHTYKHAVAALAEHDTVPIESELARRIVRSAIEQTTYTHEYDPAYARLSYPGGDVPRERGVCCDVVVRGLRACGLDLQQLVHEDMKDAFSAYPRKWGLAKPDPNIDHRRVPNLMTYFARHDCARPVTRTGIDYAPGDVVAWRLSNGLLHIGLVTNIRADDSERLLVAHNIGAGTKVEDVLFSWEIIGHYRITTSL